VAKSFMGWSSHRTESRILPENSSFVIGFSESYQLTVFVRDSQPFSEAQISCQKPNPIVGIKLDWPIADQIA
jgi:hypothetical protein